MGVQSTVDSWLENLISKGSCVPAVIGFVPKAIQCLSTSETKTLRATTRTSLAPVRLVKATALVLVPLVASQ